MMILPIAALLLALSTSSLAHPSPFPGNSPTPSPSHSTSSSSRHHGVSAAESDFDLFHPKDVKTLVLASVKKTTDRKAYDEALFKVYSQLETGIRHLKKLRIELYLKPSHQEYALEVMNNLHRSAVALPDFIEAMKVVEPKTDDEWERTHRFAKNPIKSHVESLVSLFKKDFTDAKEYAAVAREHVDVQMYDHLRPFERLLVDIPRAYHMLRITNFLQEVIQRRSSLKDARASKDDPLAIKILQGWLVAVKVPIVTRHSDDVPRFDSANFQRNLKFLELISMAQHPKLGEDSRYAAAIKSLDSPARILHGDALNAMISVTTEASKTIEPYMYRNRNRH
ncbi:hypothetical protein BJ684DRAFT_19452 [Piptocephalis cylindrospora]|uniref:Uncharacterized protein n=1 Tax=Piptocephalis cylindrospora TaxID=1907219 RepID=A0A4V1IYC9_9FUNG|nr:hypothetical protein BJ684DRAFT_19452 [Piptocephalis cylindrospora]|eukprot:RKP14119.1 hypothetical protein BJ684DRAFT_19452 [Piptocephalis cylindrospora]